MKKLIIPITHLKEQMDKTNIENLNFDIELPEKEDMLDELISLNNGYRKLMLRIKEGIIREERLGQLQMRTNMDVLQAQINPHFINNTLNVISYRGALSGDDDICEICNCITQMLQYTTNLKKRVATVREEIEYLEMYLMILKHRYREKLVYEIQIDEQIYCERLPKITLQQIVENSISHGYNHLCLLMEIQITGWIEDGWWYLKVQDNGEGFDKEVLNKLNHEQEKIREIILEEKRVMDMEIGGMGIINIYSRMLLLLEKDFIFKLSNTVQGAEVIIGAKMEKAND